MMNEHNAHQERHVDTRTNEELIRAALTEADEDVAWKAIGELQGRGSRDVFDHACKLCVSPEAHERRVGVDILGQLGTPHPTFHEETVTVLLRMLEQEQEPDVLYSVAVALGHHSDPRAIVPLVRLKGHPDDLVRFGVVFGLLCYEDELAIQTLIELSTDTDAHVRDWATFGLGSQIDTDTPTIRAALVARLTDEDADTKREAMVGLARRHDPRMAGPGPLLADLEED
ncbi:MAG: HEAT repeat domain-containing protein [Chloroflexota bacterium]|nr:HEAT repeat domain-containing protein [Chloroflexota bacterium]